MPLASAEGERKQVTVVFCDVVNSTVLAERIGADAMHGVLNRFFELAIAEVRRYGGTINQFLGDGFMALFGAPAAYEDHAERAGLAALAIQHQLRERAGDIAAGFAVRMGINSGLVVVGSVGDTLRNDYTAVGDTTHLASRVQQLADPGTIYVSHASYCITEQVFEYEALGMRAVKGLTERVAVYRLCGLLSTRGRRRGSGEHGIGSALVGRDAEIHDLVGCIQQLVAGRGGLALVVGEAGVGKSRLFAELKRREQHAGLTWLEGRGVSFGAALSYYPFTAMLRDWASLSESDTPAQSWDKLEGVLRPLLEDRVTEVLPYLATLAGLEAAEPIRSRLEALDTRAMKGHIFRACRVLFECLAGRGPVVLVFDDIHWIDQSSMALLEHLIPITESLPLLVCCVGRPDQEPGVVQLAEIAIRQLRIKVVRLTLGRLSDAASTRLLRNLLAGGDLPASVRSLVLSKAEGNPFFMEEVVRALIDMRALVRDRTSGAWRSTAEVSRITIPATIEGIIMARVDHLAEPVKTTLKLASVIGRQFRAGVLRVIGTEPHADIDAHLAELQRLDFIREREGRSDVEYVFKHAIIQGVVYDSILASRRQELHRQVAMAIEQLFAGRLDDLYGLLAYHYARAELWERAQHYLFNAGDQAVRVAADVETLAHYRDALAAYEQAFGTSLAPLQRAQLDRKMGEALFRRGDHEQALEYLQRAVRALGIRYPRTWLGTRCFLLGHLVIQLAHRAWPALLVRGGDSDPVAVELSRTCQAIGWIDYFIDQERFVLDCLIELNVSERGGYQEGAVSGQMATGVVLDHLGLLSLSRGYHRRGMALAEKLQRPIGLAFAHFGLAMHEHHALGELTSALSHYRHAADAWHELGDLRRWGASVYSMAWIQRLLGDVEPSLEQAQALIRVGEESADQHVLAWGHHGRGRVLYQIGDLAGAIDHLQRAIALFLSVPDYHFAQCATSDLGRCHLQAGDVETARARLSEALTTITTRKFRGFLSVPAFTGMAEVCLAEAERAAPGRGAALAGAKRACTLALQKARQTPEWTPVASRLRGTFECLAGEPAAAWRWWQESLNTATRLGLRHEVGLTHLEIGRRTGRDDHIDQATKILTSVGASRVLWRTLSELALGQ